MSMLLELKPRDRAGPSRKHRSRPPAGIARAHSFAASAFDDRCAPSASRMLGYLPAALVATGLTIVLPAVAAAALVPHGGVLTTVLSAVGAVVLSLCVAAVGAALWKRRPGARDVVFAELMLWGWLRRYRAERHLSQARELFEAARRAGPRVNIELLLGLSRLLEARDSYLHGHSQRVARHAARIGRAMGLSAQEVAMLSTAAEVHDVGKIYTPRAILNNPDRLTDEEFDVIKQHSACGAEMVSVVGDPEITAMVRHHHERVDGTGYPDGLAGSAIPLGARIIAVADTFDAITSERAYRRARSQKVALDIIAAEAGTQLDEAAVAAFKQGYSARRSVAWYAFAATAGERAAAALQSLASHIGIGAASVATLAPALGAAGVLAVSPGLFRESQAPQPAAGSLALLQSLASAAAPGGQGASGEPGNRSSVRAGAPDVRARIAPPAGARRGAPSTGTPAGGGQATDVTGQDGGAGAGSQPDAGSSPGAGSPTPAQGLPGTPQTPLPPSPEVKPPAVTVPSVGTPAVSTPAVTTPSVSTPAVTVPGIVVPSVTVPSVTVPGVTVP
jgi:hypothetical protein